MKGLIGGPAWWDEGKKRADVTVETGTKGLGCSGGTKSPVLGLEIGGGAILSEGNVNRRPKGEDCAAPMSSTGANFRGRGAEEHRERRREGERERGRERKSDCQRADGLMLMMICAARPENRAETRVTGRNLGGAARCQSVRSNRVDVCAMLLGIEGRATYLIRFPYERSKKTKPAEVQQQQSLWSRTKCSSSYGSAEGQTDLMFSPRGQ